jgi:4-hydroxyphenylacetate 3-monooxygenase
MVRTGSDYIEALKANPPNLWLKGEKIEDPTEHPAFRGVVGSMARLYDMQHDPEHKDTLTYTSPTSGKPVGMSFLEAKTKEDLAKRSAAYKTWADDTLGMMGRTPDYLNAALMAYATSADYFAAGDPRFGDNVRDYYEYVRENDLCTTHVLTNPQVNRSASTANQPDPYIAVGVVEENDKGVVVRGARQLATLPVADEVLVFPSTVLKEEEGADKYAVAFAIPTNAPGLHFVCRESLAGKTDSAFDYPVSSRFEEQDALAVFDDVLVPWDRVFVLNSVPLCNNAYTATGALNHMAHQVVTHKVAKTESFLGLATLMAEGIGANVFPQVKDRIVDIITTLEAMRGLKEAAEARAETNEYGLMCPARPPLDAARNMYPQVFPRVNEVVQLTGASGMIIQMSEEDFEGEAAPYVEKYLQGKNLPAREKVRLFRLAWDMVLSGFGARQALYERFFFGDPVRMRPVFYDAYDKEPSKEKIQGFLRRAEETSIGTERASAKA